MDKLIKYGNYSDAVKFKSNIQKKVLRRLCFFKTFNRRLLKIIFNDIRSLSILDDSTETGFYIKKSIKKKTIEFKTWTNIFIEKDDKMLYSIFSIFNRHQLRTILNIYKQELTNCQKIILDSGGTSENEMNEAKANKINIVIRTIKNIFNDFNRWTIYTAIIMAVASVATAVANIITLVVKL